MLARFKVHFEARGGTRSLAMIGQYGNVGRFKSELDGDGGSHELLLPSAVGRNRPLVP
jgi:hypothetical protein